MKEKPILFNSEMVKAILEGRKTQTRRVVKPSVKGCTVGAYSNGRKPIEPVNVQEDGDPWTDIKCPYGKIGDKLWIKERFYKYTGLPPYLPVRYFADNPVDETNCAEASVWLSKPSIFMFRKDSRINLEITDIRVERVQEISEEDAKAEGACKIRMFIGFAYGFRELWDSINGKPRRISRHSFTDISWKANPWVWVVCFKLVK